MIAFLDTNVPIYAAGREHELKAPCVEILRLAVEYEGSFLTSAEVLQELLQRYKALGIWPAGFRVLLGFAELMRGRTEPILAEDVESAGRLAAEFTHLSARDLIHVAVMRRSDVACIVSADRGFDGLPGITRLDPARLPEWRDQVTGRPV